MKKARSKGLRFHRIRLENWKNFTHVDVHLQARAFLVGPNASGKSNFLEDRVIWEFELHFSEEAKRGPVLTKEFGLPFNP